MEVVTVIYKNRRIDTIMRVTTKAGPKKKPRVQHVTVHSEYTRLTSKVERAIFKTLKKGL
jgi:hypothetical protein